jgi:hypothetical protein
VSGKPILIVLAAFTLATFPAGLWGQSAEWRPLFNQRDLSGWDHVGEGAVVVEDGLMKTVGGLGLLVYSVEPFGPAELRVEYRYTADANSGVFIRLPTSRPDPAPPYPGHEIQIQNAESPYHTTGSVYTVSAVAARPSSPDVWNTMIIRIEGDRTLVHINGVLVTDYREGDPAPPRGEWWEPERGDRPSRGYIGIQNHPVGPPVYFRTVEVRSISDG